MPQVTGRRLNRLITWCAFTACGVLVIGCEHNGTSSTAPAKPPARAADVVLDTPEDATRSLLHQLREHLRAIAGGDKAAAARHRDQVVWHIVAQDDVMAAYNANPLKQDQSRTEVLDTLVQSWAAIISYYSDGLELDRTALEHATESKAAVLVPAHSGPDQAIIQVACLLDDNEEWRIVGLGFAHFAPAAARPNEAQPAATSDNLATP